ncbi:MAG: XdhC family protein [Leptolinea sp.]|nr:XdhC family protein [Leptolinea sp.]
MKKFYSAMVEMLTKGESFAVATLFDKTGSAPRSDGAKMLVREKGPIIGTIGGGRLEAEAIELSKKMITQRKTVIQKFDLTGKDAAESDMICGGKGEILIDFIDANDVKNIEIYSEAVRIMETRGKAWLVTILGQTPGEYDRQQCLVKPDKTMIGRVVCDQKLLGELINGPAKITLHSEVFDNRRFLVEPLREGGTVYIFGAGHVSQKIAPLSEGVGFRTVVLDDRVEYANRERFPIPIEVRVIEDFTKLPDLGIDDESYLIIVTRGHMFDKDVLAQVLRSGAGYIGMIGSRIKRELTYKDLMEHGFTEEELSRVYSPIGTAILAETPEELGISIVGELIKVRAERYKIAN